MLSRRPFTRPTTMQPKNVPAEGRLASESSKLPPWQTTEAQGSDDPQASERRQRRTRERRADAEDRSQEAACAGVCSLSGYCRYRLWLSRFLTRARCMQNCGAKANV